MRGSRLKVLSIVGARPQFIKAAVVSKALRDVEVDEILVHTGQHYDDAMSASIFKDLALREPDINLGIGSARQGDQTGRMLAALEKTILESAPDRVLIYGDTNSTIAGALAAAKLGVPVDHVEAGLRSFDRDMPEEVNRIVADQLADLLFCPTNSAVDNLAREGVTEGVFLVGDVMLDLALATREVAICAALPDGLSSGDYFLATIHRASNTDDPERLSAVIAALCQVSRELSLVVLPAHPRLRARLKQFSITTDGLLIRDPVDYSLMQTLLLHSRGVITDSGGVQKEALFNGVRCITLRDSTEWPETVRAGMNTLIPDLADLTPLAESFGGRVHVSQDALEAFGGGQAGHRIAECVMRAGSSRRRWRVPCQS